MLLILNNDGSTFHARYIGGSSNEYGCALRVSNNDVFISGKTNSNDYPVTDAILYGGQGDAFLTRLSFCATDYDIADDTLSPAVQTVCRYGIANTITGKRITLPGSSLPTIYYNGISGLQRGVDAWYQWQSATAASGPWTDIPGATLPDYTPVTGGADQYFRRLSFSSPTCGSQPIHTSAVATVLVNSLTAPAVNAGGPFVTCPGSTMTIGGPLPQAGERPPIPIAGTWERRPLPIRS